MRRISRLQPSIERLCKDTRKDRYICSSCRVRAVVAPRGSAPFSTTANVKQDSEQKTKDANDSASILSAPWRKLREAVPALGKKDEDGPAALEKVIEKAEDEFVSATTWDGLQWVATPDWFKQEHHPKGEFDTFFAPQKITEPEHIEEHLKNSLIEAATIDLSTLDRPQKELRLASLGVKFGVNTETGQPIVQFPTENSKNMFFKNLKMPGESWEEIQSKSSTSISIGKDPLSPQAAQWRRISLVEPHFRLAVIKRFMRRTGIVLSDPVISNIKTASDLYREACVLPVPKKLAHRLQTNENMAVLQQLKNVGVSTRRITKVDREKTIGRWKVIEKELVERGLPVLKSEFKYSA